MLDGYLVWNGTEVVNHARLQAYVDAGFAPNMDALDICGCPTLGPSLDTTYVSPSADPAPWYDAAVPESAEFAGFWLLSVTGDDTRPTSRSVSQSVTGGGVFGRQRVTPRTIVVSGVLLGQSCCGVAYGLRWLGQALDGCTAPGCDGADLEILSCCPPEDVGSGDLFATYGRTMRRVALSSGPTVTRRAGDGCQAGCTADVIFVEFILTAAEPWAWTAPVEMLSESVPLDEESSGDACVEWVLVAEGEGCTEQAACCRLSACATGAVCGDPNCATPSAPAVATPRSCYCLPLAVNESCHEIETTAFGSVAEVLPIITVSAGSTDLRRLTISFYEKTDPDAECCVTVEGALTYDDAATTYDDADVTYDDATESAVDAERCNPAAVYHVGYLQAGAEMVFDGQVRRALVTCNGISAQASDAWGLNGAPVDFSPLGCARTYCVVLEADALYLPADDATVTLELTGRE